MISKKAIEMDEEPPFEHGTRWLRTDFHLHTRADKEFEYGGAENDFAKNYVEALKTAEIELGIITNHNKFNLEEFKALRKRASKEGIGLLPGIELSVSDGSNGIHTLVVFSDKWFENGNDYINQFLGTAFAGKVPAQYENENGRTNAGLIETLKQLEQFNRDFFIVFAHVEADSGLWKELDGGRLTELAQNPLVQRHCLGFQKVRTHDKPGAKCRVQVKKWWHKYPAELEGSDPKKISEIGRGEKCYVYAGAHSFEAVQFALRDFPYRVSAERRKHSHSFINAVRFEGGMLEGVRISFSPHMNCLIGIQGSGKSAVLESVRYALDITFGERAQDRDYKEELLPYVLGSGGKIVLEAQDRLGTNYEVHRIIGHQPDVYVEGVLRQGVSIRETIVFKPLYFGQKDLSAAGKGFGSDLVEKLIGDSLRQIRQRITGKQSELKQAAKVLIDIRGEADNLEHLKQQLNDITFRLEQFDKHKVKETMEEQVQFEDDIRFCETVEKGVENWKTDIEDAIDQAEESLKALEIPKSKRNEKFFQKYAPKIDLWRTTVKQARKILSDITVAGTEIATLGTELDASFAGLKDDFAKVQRELTAELAKKGLKAIKPDAYVALTKQKGELERQIKELSKKVSKEAAQNKEVLKLATEFSDLLLAEFRDIEKALAKINGSQSSLEVSASFKGDKSEFQKRLEELCRGTGIRKDTLQAVAAAYPDFAGLYKEIDEGSKLVKAKAEEFKQLFHAELPSLLTYQVPNTFEINYHGKPLKSHSLGQRASAMMLFLLSQDDSDLLILDQPEDDLDSQTVYEEVVKLVRKLKPGRQFIFATHNPNFPVLGDTEIVAACEATDKLIQVTASSIDSPDSQAKIVKIMEGGAEAFARRKTIYETWHAG